MPQLTISPSPSAAIVITRYEKGGFPLFDQLFENPSPESPLRHLARDPKEASVSVVLENRSQKPVTALRYRWAMTDNTGKQRTRNVSNDSYALGLDRPTVAAGSRQLIGPFDSVDESLIRHVQAGGGLISCSGGKPDPSLDELLDLAFEVYFVLFEDGEIASVDPDRFGRGLHCRKRAAEFVAKQIRAAKAEGRDLTPVLSAIVDLPALGSVTHPEQGDQMVHWTQYFAGEYLRAMQHPHPRFDRCEAELRTYESLPAVPRFYRPPQ